MQKKYSLFFLLFTVVAFTSCIKKEVTPLGDEGKTFVKIVGGGSPAEINKNPIDFVGTPQRLLACDIRKDAANNSALNTVTTVVVKDDTAAVRAANPNYINMPTAWYTLESEAPRVGGMGGTYTFQFKAGEFAKQIYINIPNATVLDPSSLYAIGFTITSVSADGSISVNKSMVLEIGAKNEWDGSYAVTGPVTDIITPNLIQWENQPGYSDPWLDANPGAWEAHLVTTGASQCIVVDNTIWGSCGHALYNTTAAGNTGYGSFGLVINFDPATGAVASIWNYYGDPSRAATNLGTPAGGSGAPNYAASNTRRAVLDPSGVNAVQGNKDILIKYLMVQPNSGAPGPDFIRTTFDEKWAYTGSR